MKKEYHPLESPIRFAVEAARKIAKKGKEHRNCQSYFLVQCDNGVTSYRKISGDYI